MLRRNFLGVLAGFLPSILIRRREDAVVVPRTNLQEWIEELVRTEKRKIYITAEESAERPGTIVYKRAYI